MVCQDADGTHVENRVYHGIFWTGQQTFWFGNNREISWRAERLLASQQGSRGIKLHSIAGTDRQKLTNRKKVNIFSEFHLLLNLSVLIDLSVVPSRSYQVRPLRSVGQACRHLIFARVAKTKQLGRPHKLSRSKVWSPPTATSNTWQAQVTFHRNLV